MKEKILSSVKDTILKNDSFDAFYTCSFKQSSSEAVNGFIKAEQITDKNLKEDILSGAIEGAIVVVLHPFNTPTKLTFFVDKDYHDNACITAKYLTVTCHKIFMFSEFLPVNFGTKTIILKNSPRFHGKRPSFKICSE